MLRARKHANRYADIYPSVIIALFHSFSRYRALTKDISCYRALTKDIDIGLSIQRIEDDVVEEFLIQGGAVSPIVTIEPRRRKFHKV